MRKTKTGRTDITLRAKLIASLLFILLAAAAMTQCVKKDGVDDVEETSGTTPIDVGEAYRKTETGAPANAAVPEIRMDVMPVTAIKVYSTGGKETSWFPGKTAGRRKIPLSFDAAGTVASVRVRVGQGLHFEYVLAELNSSGTEMKIRELENQLASANVKSIKAFSNLNKIRKLRQQNAATDAQLDSAMAEAIGAEIAVRSARKQVQTQRMKLEGHEIRVAQMAVVSEVEIKPGDRVEAGQTAIVINETGPLEITVSLPAILISQYGPGNRCKIRLKSSGKVYPGSVVDIGEPTPGPDGAFPATVRFKYPYNNLSAGMEVEVNIDNRVKGSRIVLAPSMIGRDAKGYFVWIVRPAEGDYGVVERRQVVLGDLNGFGQQVASGLQDGEVIVTQGLDRLKHGQKVRWK